MHLSLCFLDPADLFPFYCQPVNSIGNLWSTKCWWIRKMETLSSFIINIRYMRCTKSFACINTLIPHNLGRKVWSSTPLRDVKMKTLRNHVLAQAFTATKQERWVLGFESRICGSRAQALNLCYTTPHTQSLVSLLRASCCVYNSVKTHG